MVPFFFLSMAALRTTDTKLSVWLFQPIRLWLRELPYRAKGMVPSERAMKTESETGVKSDTPFFSRLPIEKTNSEEQQKQSICVTDRLVFSAKGKIMHELD